MIVPLSLTDQEAEQFKRFAKSQNRTLTEMIRAAVREKIQDEDDWRIYKEALADYQLDPKTISLKEMKREGGSGNVPFGIQPTRAVRVLESAKE